MYMVPSTSRISTSPPSAAIVSFIASSGGVVRVVDVALAGADGPARSIVTWAVVALSSASSRRSANSSR